MKISSALSINGQRRGKVPNCVIPTMGNYPGMVNVLFILGYISRSWNDSLGPCKECLELIKAGGLHSVIFHIFSSYPLFDRTVQYILIQSLKIIPLLAIPAWIYGDVVPVFGLFPVYFSIFIDSPSHLSGYLSQSHQYIQPS